MEQAGQPSFAVAHQGLGRGFTAVPRWWRKTPFWQSLPAAHRAVLDELYFRVARRATKQKNSGLLLERGQWAMSFSHLAKAAGASVEQARAAVRKAVSAGIIRHHPAAFTTPTGTVRRTIFTWVDFEHYDAPKGTSNRSAHGSPNASPNESASGITTPDGKPQPENPTTKTHCGGDGRDVMAGLPPVPAGLDTPEFNAAWCEYAEYRTQLGTAKKLTAIGAVKLLNQLLPLGPQEAIRRMNTTMAKGWIGVVFDNDKHQRSSHGNAPRTRRLEEQLEL